MARGPNGGSMRGLIEADGEDDKDEEVTAP